MGDAGKAGRWVRNNTTFLLFAGGALILSRSPGLAVLGMAVLAYTLTQRTGWLFGGGPERTQTGNTSTVRTSYLEVSLDRTTCQAVCSEGDSRAGRFPASRRRSG